MSSDLWPKRFRQEVARYKNPRQALNSIRRILVDEDPRKVFEELFRYPMFRQNIAVSSEPRKFSDLWHSKRLTSRGIIADLQWEAEVINFKSDIVLGFIKAEHEFSKNYILGKWDYCLKALDELEEKHGLSLWLISRRITVMRRISGLSEDNYAAKLIASANDGSIMSWLVYMMSFRADPNLTPATYVRVIESTLQSINISDHLVSFLRYHALSIPPRNVENSIGIIASSETAPIIDRYMGLLDTLQFITGFLPPESQERSIVRKTARRLSESIPDDRLVMLDEVNSPEKIEELASRVRTEEADLYTAGNYVEATTNLSSRVREHSDQTNIYSLLVRSSIRANISPDIPEPLSDIIRTMAAVQTFSKEEDARLIELSREALVGAHRSLSITIRSLFMGISEDPSNSSLDDKIEALNNNTLTPLQLRHLPVLNQRELISKAEKIFPESISLELQGAVINFGNCDLKFSLRDRLPSDRAALYSARALLRMGRLHEAVELLEKLESNSVALVANDARRELYRAFIEANQFREALRLVARAYQHNERLHAIFKLDPLLDGVEQSGDGPPFDEISLSICYHIINRFERDQRVGAQGDAAEEFVFSCGVNLPSEIDPNTMETDKELFILYLDQVCTAPIIDKFMEIENVNQVENERLAICRILSEIDPSNRQRYLDEIREITRRRVVRDRFEQVERTKIYVDTDGVKRQAEKILHDSYQRFIVASIEENNTSERIEIVRQVQKVLTGIEADGVKLHFPDLPASEGDQIFDSLVREVMRLLVSSQEYGLEAYLSTRVRHGTMGNQLRSAFELQSLLTQRDNGRYQPDSHWVSALGLENSVAGHWLAQRIAKFSEDLDALIENLVRKRVQVKSEATPEGLFIFQAFNYDVVRLQSEITSETSFETFLDKVIDQFWKILEYTLVEVRRYIENDFLSSVHKLTDDFEKNVIQELSENISPLRDSIAAARTQMSFNVANVANWFTLARDMERQDYEFGIAVEVATESIRVCHPSLDVTLERSDKISFDCRGKTLESLVYMLFTALDNSLEHCGFSDHAPKLLLETKLEDQQLELRLINSCAPVENLKEENEKLRKLRDRLESGNETRGLATTEGGSGYAKIIRILRHDLLAHHSLEFGYRNSTEYAVTITIDARTIIK